MKKHLPCVMAGLLVMLFAMSLPALAAKGEGGRKSGSTDSGWSSQDDRQKSKEPYQQQQKQEKGAKQPEKLDADDQGPSAQGSGVGKQRDKKMEQERTEAGKGSETGQQKRAEHSRKWWRFWE